MFNAEHHVIILSSLPSVVVEDSLAMEVGRLLDPEDNVDFVRNVAIFQSFFLLLKIKTTVTLINNTMKYISLVWKIDKLKESFTSTQIYVDFDIYIFMGVWIVKTSRIECIHSWNYFFNLHETYILLFCNINKRTDYLKEVMKNQVFLFLIFKFIFSRKLYFCVNI